MRGVTGLAFSAAAAVCLAGPVRADATVVSETTLSGMPARPGAAGKDVDATKPVRSTVRYKGGAMRTESAEGAVIATARRMIFIDDQARKWSAMTPGKGASGADALLKMVDMKTDATVRATGKSATILGRPARQWVVDAVIRMKLPDISGMFGGGGEPKPKPAAPPVATIRVRTEVWTTDAVDVGGPVAFLGGAGAAPGSSFLGPMLEKMRAIPGLPLRVSMTQTFEGAMLGRMASKPVKVRTEVVSIDERTLPASMFAPPAGYKQVPYVAPSFMNLPMGGGSGGFGPGTP